MINDLLKNMKIMLEANLKLIECSKNSDDSTKLIVTQVVMKELIKTSNEFKKSNFGILTES